MIYLPEVHCQRCKQKAITAAVNKHFSFIRWNAVFHIWSVRCPHCPGFIGSWKLRFMDTARYRRLEHDQEMKAVIALALYDAVVSPQISQAISWVETRNRGYV